MNNFLGNVFQSTNDAGVLFPASHNGILSHLLHSKLTTTDAISFSGSIKRPDVSYRIRPRQMPHPVPHWIKLLPSGALFPNVVVEVAVNDEGVANLTQDCHLYFSELSICIWVRITIWHAEKTFWIG